MKRVLTGWVILLVAALCVSALSMYCLAGAPPMGVVESWLDELPPAQSVGSTSFKQNGIGVTIMGYGGSISVGGGLVFPVMSECTDEYLPGVRVAFSKPMHHVELWISDGVEAPACYALVRQTNRYGQTHEYYQLMTPSGPYLWSYSYGNNGVIVGAYVLGGAPLDYIRAME